MVFIVIVIGIGGYFVLVKKSGPIISQPTPAPTPSVTPTPTPAVTPTPTPAQPHPISVDSLPPCTNRDNDNSLPSCFHDSGSFPPYSITADNTLITNIEGYNGYARIYKLINHEWIEQTERLPSSSYYYLDVRYTSVVYKNG